MDPNKLFTHERLSEFVDNYKEYIEKKKKEQDTGDPTIDYYNYYNFDINPDGLIISSKGRYGEQILNTNPSWKPMTFKNGIDGWKMTLAKLLANYKRKEYNLIDGSKSEGLNYIINYDELPMGVYYGVPNLDIDQRNFSFTTSIEHTDRGKDNSVKGIGVDFSTLNESVNNNLSNVRKMHLYNYKLISVDYYGLFYGDIATYNIECKGENCLFYVWTGDDAICEFVKFNAQINNNKTTSDNFSFPIRKFIPIRIQIFFYANVIDNVEFNLTVNKLTYKDGVQVKNQVPIKDVLFNAPKYPPLLLYFAFVSANQNDFINDKFKCTSIVDIKNDELIVKSYVDLNTFYKTMKQYLADVLANTYDYNNDNRLSYGVIPSINVEYTIDDSKGVPFAYSIYKIDSDERMGKIYQIQGKLNENMAYPMKELSPNVTNSVVTYSDVYRTLPGFYPNKDSVSLEYYNESVNADPLMCRDLCNKNANCNHYFTYTSDDVNKCVIDTKNSTPYFNRVPPTNTLQPIDVGSSSLNVRDYQIDISGDIQSCITMSNENRDGIPVVNTSNYSDTFQFANYNLDDSMVTDVKQMGLCGDAEYIKKTNEAADILFKDTTYYKDGSWEGFENKIPEQKYTDAMKDTGDAVRTNLRNEEVYAKKMDAISKKKKHLEDKLIPEYINTRIHLEKEEKNDYSGSELYFRKKRAPTIQEKIIMDNNQLYLNTKLLYTLGTVTTATLIVLAIVLARD